MGTMPGDLRFPDGFLWGAATAGHQVEGNNIHSNWWQWEQLGLVDDGTTSGRAVDYWNRWPEDHALVEDLGFGVFRLGIEWARIEPAQGRFDEVALAHYVEMIADLSRRGVKVCLTLNHWVVPQWFADNGDWLAKDAVAHWERFIRFVVPSLAPYVDLWITLNEPSVPYLVGNLIGYHPPMRRSPRSAHRVFVTLLRAHTVAYHAIHELVPEAPDGGPTQVGVATAYQFIEPYHTSGPARSLEGALCRLVRYCSFGAWDRALQTGRYRSLTGRVCTIDGLAGSYDFVGVNYYTRVSVSLAPSTLANVKSGEFAAPPGVPVTEMGWQVYPQGFRAILNHVAATFDAPIYVTENGCCDSGDADRRSYIVRHLAAMHAAIGDGADVRGYMHWSFTDNFEWREGFAKRFGMVRVDHDDPGLIRRPRDSAAMLSDIAAANAITSEIASRYAPGVSTSSDTTE
ncbi:MAG: glycoside hydrolase family 1 protein [Actinobacteria bacterium]|nr:glycoside hydrolase family 1 protein [Actinomycetota bacterium]